MLYRTMGKTGDPISILGYGCMRFPLKNGKIDEERAEKQILLAIEKGVNYFDTAILYHGGKSESFIGSVLSKGYRDKVKIATKLLPGMVHTRKDMDDILDSQLKKLKTNYIDYYLMHALQDMKEWNRLKQLGVLEFIQKAKQEGKIKHIGFSFHGVREEFKALVDDYAWEFCQIQYNYLDEYHQAGKEGLEYAASKGLGVIIMEPLRGGRLVGQMPGEVQQVWEQAEVKRTPAEWALRWIWNHPGVTTVLSGMGEEAHIEENTRIAADAYPGSFSAAELKVVDKAKEIYKRLLKVGCTGCGYCLPCPAGVDIPLCFNLYNSKHLFNNPRAKIQYLGFASDINKGTPTYASLCVNCGKCEKACPQHLPVRKHLKDVAREMEIPMMRTIIWGVKKFYRLRSFINKLRR